MPSLYETLHFFRSPQGQLLEIKRLDQPESPGANRAYLWLWVTERTVASLKLLDSRTDLRQTRHFREAQLSFDEQGGELSWHDGRVIALTNEHGKEPDALRKRLIRNHLS
jgi:hypothetical protein